MNTSATPFQEKVYALATKIPKGKVATYGQLARLVGSPSAARAVGMCMKTNRDLKKVSCHRVVASNGALTGYAFGGVGVKKQKLLKEGVVFKGNKVELKVSMWKK